VTFAYHRNYLQLNHPVVKVIDTLFTHQAHHASFGCFLACRRDVPASKVTGTDVKNYPLSYQAIKGLPGLVPGAFVIDVVRLIQVDPVRLKPFQAALAVFLDLHG
jgi:hypothetical protein